MEVQWCIMTFCAGLRKLLESLCGAQNFSMKQYRGFRQGFLQLEWSIKALRSHSDNVLYSYLRDCPVCVICRARRQNLLWARFRADLWRGVQVHMLLSQDIAAKSWCQHGLKSAGDNSNHQTLGLSLRRRRLCFAYKYLSSAKLFVTTLPSKTVQKHAR